LRIAQIVANEPSYVWDKLIEAFSHHAWHGTQYKAEGFPREGVFNTEKSLRIMARENRTRRRALSEALLGLMEKYRGQKLRANRVVVPFDPSEAYYVFLLLPRYPSTPDEQYRRARHRLLGALCFVTKLVYPGALDIVGIATEIQPSNLHSEDSCYVDARTWTDEDQDYARKLQTEFNLLTDVTMTEWSMREYPDLDPPSELVRANAGKNPRNKPCPCGSGKKYKRCHGGS
jgi:hypothetical protein